MRTALGFTLTLRPGLPDPAGMRDLRRSARLLPSAGLSGFLVLISTRLVAGEMSGVLTGTGSEEVRSTENDVLRSEGLGRGVVGWCKLSGRAVGIESTTAFVMPSSRRYVSIARLTSVVAFPKDLRPKCTVSGPDPRLMTPSFTVGCILMFTKAAGLSTREEATSDRVLFRVLDPSIMV